MTDPTNNERRTPAASSAGMSRKSRKITVALLTAGLAAFSSLLVGVQFTSRAWFIMLTVSLILLVSVWLGISAKRTVKDSS